MRSGAMLIASAAIVALTTPAFGGRQRAVRFRQIGPIHVPACTEIRGLANLYFSLDGGQSFSGNAETPTRVSTWQVGILEDTPNVMVAAVGSSIYDSVDAGCNWVLRHTFSDQIKHTIHATPATRGRAYVWSEEFAYRYDNGTVTNMPVPGLIGGLGVDPSNREHLRLIGASAGVVWESFDGGDTWTEIGTRIGGFVTAVAFDPTNFNRIIASSNIGLVVSTNGAKNWTATPGMSGAACDVSITRGSPNVVWVLMAVRAGRDFVFRSSNFGGTFQSLPAVIEVENNVCLSLTTHPTDANLATIPFGFMHVVNAATRTMSKTTCCSGWISRVAYSPVDPDILYVFAPAR
jgi:hypothetical protein